MKENKQNRRRVAAAASALTIVSWWLLLRAAQTHRSVSKAVASLSESARIEFFQKLDNESNGLRTRFQNNGDIELSLNALIVFLAYTLWTLYAFRRNDTVMIWIFFGGALAFAALKVGYYYKGRR